MSLLEIQDLSIEFQIDEQSLLATERVNLTLKPGEILGLVGESGCGKSATNLAILRLLSSNGRIKQGAIFFEGKNLVELSENEIRKIRGKKIAMIFQEPMTALNPVYTVGKQLQETIRLHWPDLNKTQVFSRALELLAAVGIDSPIERMKQYPHELSGGLRQRSLIAIALSGDPQLLIADEPTTALDVTIQAQVLELLKNLVRQRNMSLILISHDFGVVAQMCDRIAVMYAGKIVEEGQVPEIFTSAKHPYTKGLIESLEQLDLGDRSKGLKAIRGQMPALSEKISGCRFFPRCDFSVKSCSEKEPAFQDSVACFNPVRSFT